MVVIRRESLDRAVRLSGDASFILGDVMEFVLGLLVLIVMGVVIWWDWENPDKKSTAIGTLDAESVRLNNERKDRQIANLEGKIKQLNQNTSGKRFYRRGARILEHTPEEVSHIAYVEAEYARINAPYPSHQKHAFIIDKELVLASEEQIRRYKFEEKMRKINRGGTPGVHCAFDHRNGKLINKITGAEIPFDPDEYTLAAIEQLDSNDSGALR